MDNFKPKVLTVDEKEQTIIYTYYNKSGMECKAKFGYVFIRELIEKYLRDEGMIA